MKEKSTSQLRYNVASTRKLSVSAPARRNAVDGSGSVYVTGRSVGRPDPLPYGAYDFATIKYDSSGVEEWVSRYNGSWDANDGAQAIAVDGSSNVMLREQPPSQVPMASIAFAARSSTTHQAQNNGPDRTALIRGLRRDHSARLGRVNPVALNKQTL